MLLLKILVSHNPFYIDPSLRLFGLRVIVARSPSMQIPFSSRLAYYYSFESGLFPSAIAYYLAAVRVTYGKYKNTIIFPKPLNSAIVYRINPTLFTVT